MDLFLEIISHQRHSMTEKQSQFVFKAAGGSIGRNQSNNWIIEDPERLISGQHASVYFESDHFIIIDNSTNGLFVNNDQQPLGKNQHIIANGDVFLLGQYSLQATLIATQSKAVFSSSDHHQNNHSSALNQASVLGGTNISSISADNAYDEPSIPIFPHEVQQNASQFIDPLSQFNEEISPGRLLEQDILSEPDPVNSILDPIPSTQSYFDLPNAIPENWLKNPSEENNHKIKSVHSHLSQAPVLDEHVDESVQASHFAPVSTLQENHVGNFEDFKNDYNSGSSNHSTSTEIKKSIDNNDIALIKNKVDIRAENKPTVSNSNVSSNTIHSQAVHILLDTIGINPDDVSEEQLPELTKNIALITKNSMTGMMQTMISRAHLKNEFRMSMTTIQTQENNPLKFCINYEQLVHYMLVKPMSGYLDSEKAIKESFEELQEHQVGVMAGMKSALNYMLDKLSPEKIIEKSDRTKSKTLGLSSKKSRYWDAYNEVYKDIKDEDDAFTTLFGNEFCKAYERQIDDIRQARK